jgi:hypothetical protein
MKYISSLQSLRRKVGLKPMDPREPTDLIPHLVARWEKEVGEAIDQKALALHSRWRPPMRFGIFLVILGFILQTVGTIGAIN